MDLEIKDRFILFGIKFIESPYMTKRVMVRTPEFQRYEWLRQFSLYRYCRAAYIRWVRRRWQNDPDNWEDVPRQEMLKLPSGHLVIHPAMRNEIAKRMGGDFLDYGKDNDFL